MENTKQDEIRENALVEEVIRELKRRLYREKDTLSYAPARQALILGKLTGDEEKALSALYTPVEFRSKSAPDYDILVSAHLSIEAMACLALGVPGNEEAACILYSLLQGKRVYILERGLEYRSYRDRAHKTLYRLLQEYESRIGGFGVRIVGNVLEIKQNEELGIVQPVKLVQAAGCHLESPGAAADFSGDSLDLAGKKLLRESDFSGVRGRGKSEVLIDRDAIVTPLAMDYITNHGLEVKRR
ncbi:hypothetical protein NXH76_10745 [Blautia schinkii]|nr:hypothetical protein [Blautia schinkii]